MEIMPPTLRISEKEKALLLEENGRQNEYYAGDVWLE